eukprot:11769129-Alexandrium_andersonii.AAC.1
MKKATLADVPMPFAANDLVISVQKISPWQDSDAVCSVPLGHSDLASAGDYGIVRVQVLSWGDLLVWHCSDDVSCQLPS